MKISSNIKYVVTSIILLLLISINACNTPKQVSTSHVEIANKELEVAYNKSLQDWNKLKQKHNNSYEYSVSFASWVGYSNTTTIVVKKGKIISRIFAEKKMDDNDRFSAEEIEMYRENESTINTHERGFKGMTMDETYENCGNKSLQMSETENRLYFVTDDAGILKNCGYGLINCMDDCSRGVNISSFKWLDK